MTLDELEDLVRYAGSDETIGKLVDLLHRDWAVRVLDAWAAPSERAYSMNGEGWWWCDCVDHANKRNPVRRGNGSTPDAARLAAAQAVLPELPADVRAEIGECP